MRIRRHTINHAKFLQSLRDIRDISITDINLDDTNNSKKLTSIQVEDQDVYGIVTPKNHSN